MVSGINVVECCMKYIAFYTAQMCPSEILEVMQLILMIRRVRIGNDGTTVQDLPDYAVTSWRIFNSAIRSIVIVTLITNQTIILRVCQIYVVKIHPRIWFSLYHHLVAYKNMYARIILSLLTNCLVQYIQLVTGFRIQKFQAYKSSHGLLTYTAFVLMNCR